MIAADESNRIQADFWTAAGTMWAAMRDRFDAQANEHGLAAMDALAPKPGETVIDIGCGAGTTTVQLAQRVGTTGHVHGVDISPTMIDGAKQYAREMHANNTTFVVADAMVESFQPDADALYSRFGTMFFSDATVAFANMLTSLRPGGRLGSVCWQSPIENPWVSLPLRIASEFVSIPFGSDATAPGPFSLGDPQRLRSVLEAAGFNEVSIVPRFALANMGADLTEAVDFLSKLMPPVAALEKDDPKRAAELRDRLQDGLADWVGPGGAVQAPSAVWIVTGHRPD